MQPDQLTSDEEYARMLQEQEFSMAGYPPSRSSVPSFLNPFLSLFNSMPPLPTNHPSTEEDIDDEQPNTISDISITTASDAPALNATASGTTASSASGSGTASGTPGAPGVPRTRYYTFQWSFIPVSNSQSANNEQTSEGTGEEEDDEEGSEESNEEDGAGADNNSAPLPPSLLSFIDQVLRGGPGPMGMGPIMLPPMYFHAPQVMDLPNDMLNAMQGGMSYENLLRLAELIQPVSKAAKQTTIDQLPIEKYSTTGTEESCTICLCEFEQDQLVTKIPCHHRFHKECFIKWLEVNKICPVCRADIEESLSAGNPGSPATPPDSDDMNPGFPATSPDSDDMNSGSPVTSPDSDDMNSGFAVTSADSDERDQGTFAIFEASSAESSESEHLSYFS